MALPAEKIEYKPISINQAYNIDPSQTLTLRNAFIADSDRRFRWLERLITSAIVDLDVFGLSDKIVPMTLAVPTKERLIPFDEALRTIQARQFAFNTSAQKVEGFMDWLNEMEDRSILQIVRRPGLIPHGGVGAWSDTYIQSAYQKGILRGRHELINAGADVPKLTPQEAMSAMFNKPFHAERVGLLFTRAFNELKGIDREIDQAISRVLAQGMAEGRGPRELARILNQQIELPRVTVKIPDVGYRRLTSIQRARTLCRTEIIRAHHSATIQEYKDAQIEGVIVKAEWSTAGYGVCPLCASMEGERFDIREIEGLIPAHPNCLVDGQVKIYTSKGWVSIKDIELGDLVLTHKGRFRKVVKVHKIPKQRVSVVRFRFGGIPQTKLTVTEDHPVLIGNKWRSAKDIRIGDKIYYLASRCKQCSKLIPYYRKFCSRSCEHRFTANRQWSDPEHRKNISKKASVQMRKEYSSGIRDPYDITKNANQACRELIKKGKWILQQEEIREKGRHLINTPEQRKKASIRMKKNNPMHDPATVKKTKTSLAKLYECYPEKRLNARMAKHRKSNSMTWIEKRMSLLLDKLGIDYVFQYPILRYNVDFAIPILRIAIECDGEYWHKNKVQDLIRQRRIEKEGWFVLRYTGTKINQCLDEIEGELVRVFANHNGEYEFVELPINQVRKWELKKARTLYNLSVEDDESYIANGFVVHNCRCVALPVVEGPKEKGMLSTVSETEKIPGTQIIDIKNIPNKVDGQVYLVDGKQLKIDVYSDDVVNKYITEIKKGQELTPTFVNKDDLSWVVDGNHRAAAYMKLDRPVPVIAVDRIDALLKMGTGNMSAQDYFHSIPKKKRAVRGPAATKARKVKKKKTTPSSREVLSSGEASHVRHLGGGINETQVGEFRYQGDYEYSRKTKGVFKPIEGEHPNLRGVIDDEHCPYAYREVMASNINDAVGFDLVPPTVMRKVDGRLGSVQEWVDDAVEAANWSGRDFTRRESYEFGVLDLLLGNTDRHGGNWMRVRASGKPVAIDNGLCFPKAVNENLIPDFRQYSVSGELDPYVHKSGWVDASYTKSERKALAEKIRNVDVKKICKKLSFEEMEATQYRFKMVAEMVERGLIHPFYAYSEDYIPFTRTLKGMNEFMERLAQLMAEG